MSLHKLLYLQEELPTLNPMEINDLQIEKYIKVANLSQLARPELLSTLCIYDKKEYTRNIHYFEASDQNSHRYQLYFSRVQPDSKILNDVVFVKEAPKLLFLKGDSESLVLEEKVEDRLSDYLIYYDSKESPYLPESEARSLIMDICDSAVDYIKHKIPYDCYSPNNIVRIGEKWYLSAPGLIFGIDRDLPEYCCQHKLESEEYRHTYSWGCLLFKILFGFTPYDKDSKIKPLRQFSFKHYLAYLEQSGCPNSLLKIYYYGQRILQISPSSQSLLELALSGKMSIREWKEHNYFTIPFRHQSQLNERNREFKMINAVSTSDYSLMMAAIEYKKKYPMEKLNTKPIPSPDEPSCSEIVDNYQKNYVLKNLRFSPGFDRKQKVSLAEHTESILPTLIQDYFYEDLFDPEQDYPCRKLMQFIEHDEAQRPELYKKKPDEKQSNRECELKLYAYPYAVAFELCKVEGQQSAQIRKKIRRSIELLLELSALNFPNNVKPLHSTKPKVKEFVEMKTAYRENINQLYKHFLSEAMRKYNSKKEVSSMIEKMKRKEKGLEYYRLCLKLLEASLIVRKGGRDLDLSRIETSSRKEIQEDLEELLKSYFPNKAQIV